MQSNQLITTFEQLPYDVILLILAVFIDSISNITNMSLVSRSFRGVSWDALLAVSHNCGYYSSGRWMSSTFFNLVKIACQKLGNLRAQTPRPPIEIIPELSEKSPVCDNLTITDFDFEKSLPCDVSQVFTKKRLPVYHSLIISEVDLDKPLPFDVSQVHTLLFNLTYKQYEEERLNKFARVVKFFTINKFPSLKCLILNNVNCNNDLLKCFQEHKFEYFYLRYSSVYECIDKNSVNYEKHLKNFKTLSVKVFRMDTSSRHEYRNIEFSMPPTTEDSALHIDPVGSIPNDDPSEERILFNAKESKPSIVRLLCDPSTFRGRISFIPPLEACIEEFDCPVKRNHMLFHAMMDSIWGHNVVKLRMYSSVMEYTFTTFPKYTHKYFMGMPSYIVPDTDADVWKLR
jgi:hypothetical protein